VSAPPVRILLAKVGLDGHDRGVKIIARLLRDAGMEVIYAGLHNTPEQVVTAAIQEDADAVGISILSGAHMTVVPRVIELMSESGAGDVPIVVGGLVPEEDTALLLAAGVAAVFDQDMPMDGIPDRVRQVVDERRVKSHGSWD
jgi:methylmalonyl-CoA mutase cobalamin-binding domain/chain